MKNILSQYRNKVIVTTSSAESFSLGKKIGEACQGAEVFLLRGDLGAGKTVFAQGLALGLGYYDKVNSPTFNILKLYQIKNKTLNKVRVFCHIDAYRLDSGEDLLKLGIEEYLDAPGTVTLIEWAEKVKSVWPHHGIEIEIKAINESQREIRIM